MAGHDVLPISRTGRTSAGGLGRFIPPAVKKPATALTLLLLVATLFYVLTRTNDPFEVGVIPPNGQRPDVQAVDLDETNDYLPIELRDPTLAPLSRKLVDFLHRPALSHDAAKVKMRERCPVELADNLVNPDQYKGNEEFWKEEVTPDVIWAKRAELVNWLGQQVGKGESIIWQEGQSKGRGIVMTAGNKVGLL